MGKEHSARKDKTLVLALLRCSQQFFRSMGPVFQSAGLTSSQWDVLETLYTKGELSINELMKSILSTSGNLDVVLKNLMQAGFLEKTICKNDRRSRIVRLTKSGNAKVEGFLPEHNIALGQVFGELTGVEKRESIRILNRLRKQLMINQKEDYHEHLKIVGSTYDHGRRFY